MSTIPPDITEATSFVYNGKAYTTFQAALEARMEYQLNELWEESDINNIGKFIFTEWAKINKIIENNRT